MRIRQFDPDDRAAVIQLWRDAGLVRPWNNPERDLDRKLADSPWGMLVGLVDGDGADGGDRVVASAMVGYDGHRGSVFYLAVDPARHGQGIGSALMAHAEQLLRERGCPKINVAVRAENSQVIGFYADRGYRLEGSDYAVSLALRLVEDGQQPAT